jgi:hypothetical protein
MLFNFEKLLIILDNITFLNLSPIVIGAILHEIIEAELDYLPFVYRV